MQTYICKLFTVFYYVLLLVKKSKINKKIINLQKNVNSIEFTSNKRRLSAHSLYLKNDYLVKDTTYFYKEI